MEITNNRIKRIFNKKEYMMTLRSFKSILIKKKKINQLTLIIQPNIQTFKKLQTYQ